MQNNSVPSDRYLTEIFVVKVDLLAGKTVKLPRVICSSIKRYSSILTVCYPTTYMLCVSCRVCSRSCSVGVRAKRMRKSTA